MDEILCVGNWICQYSSKVKLRFTVSVSFQVEAELIDKLDSMVSEGKGDESYRELFGLL